MERQVQRSGGSIRDSLRGVGLGRLVSNFECQQHVVKQTICRCIVCFYSLSFSCLLPCLYVRLFLFNILIYPTLVFHATRRDSARYHGSDASHSCPCGCFLSPCTGSRLGHEQLWYIECDLQSNLILISPRLHSNGI